MPRKPTTRRPCKSCTKPTKVPDGVCQECRPSTAKRPERKCRECGGRTTAQSGVCRSCTAPPVVVSEAHALRGGQWVRKGLTQVWVTPKPRKAA